MRIRATSYFARILVAACVAATLLCAATNARADAATVSVTPTTYSFANTSYQVSEDVGTYPITITRNSDRRAGTVCWNASANGIQAGQSFTGPIGSDQKVSFPAGVASETVKLTIDDQGINGPSRYATIHLYSCSSPAAEVGADQTLTLLQDDPLQARNNANPLNYGTIDDGDPLEFVNWFVFGSLTAPGQAAALYANSNSAWASAFSLLANTPGSQSYRFWMWNQPVSSLATNVEAFLANAELAQPNTTVALSTYSLIHNGVSPSSIQSQYDAWISQLAAGIGNFKVVIYLEEDALLEGSQVSPAQLRIREAEIAYAVRALEADPHVVVYIDAGASDALITPRQMARMLNASDVSGAQGFAVNATHFQWTTTEVHWGQQISALTGGAHFVVRTDTNGRGPLLNKHPARQGIEQLCNPPGRALGPLTWRTGYKYVDGFLWFNNPGNSGGTCNGGPAVSVFWPAYAAGLVQRRVNQVTGPRLPLLRSATNM